MINDFDAVFAQWLKTKRFTADARTLAQIRLYVEGMLEEEGGYISLAHFERAYLMLREEGVIQEFREPAPAPDDELSADVVAFIQRAPVAELRRKYNSDLVFRKQYDAFNAAAAAPEVATRNLTVEEYNRLGAQEVARRYRTESTFRAAVDNLIAQGLI